MEVMSYLHVRCVQERQLYIVALSTLSSEAMPSHRQRAQDIRVDEALTIASNRPSLSMLLGCGSAAAAAAKANRGLVTPRRRKQRK